MSLTTTAKETSTEYIFTVTDGTPENTFEYRWGKTLPEGQTVQQYLQNCKREAQFLAEHELAQAQPPQEIQI